MTTKSRRLSRSSIVGTALGVADERGLAAVTLANVAAVAGCKAPSLYNHVDGLDDLLDELCLTATADFAGALRDSIVAKVGPEALSAYAYAWRDYVLAYPGRYQATLRHMPKRRSEHLAAAMGMTIPAGSMLATLGIADARLDDAGRALRSGLHGFSHLELANNIGPDPAASFASVVEVLTSGLLALAE